MRATRVLRHGLAKAIGLLETARALGGASNKHRYSLFFFSLSLSSSLVPARYSLLPMLLLLLLTLITIVTALFLLCLPLMSLMANILLK